MNIKRLLDSDFSPIEQLRAQIESRCFPDYIIKGDHTEGTYGIVFFLESRRISPKEIAVKTINPDRLHEDYSRLDELQREIAKWTMLRESNNVVYAGQIKKAYIEIPDPIDEETRHPISLPLIQMEKLEGDLDQWIGSKNFSYEDKISAIAQAFNGLAHLYKEGIQGHGDLKPSNLLFRSVGEAGNTWLSKYPWLIKISDLGWADAWLDYGLTNKSWRIYTAPERLEGMGKFVPEKSDVFSMGIIAAELLQGKHPSENLKRAKREGEWEKRARKQEWDLSGIASKTIQDFILRCLSYNAEDRPLASEAISFFSKEFKELTALDISPTLEYWLTWDTKESAPELSDQCAQFAPALESKYSHELEKLNKIASAGLGGMVQSRTIRRLREICANIEKIFNRKKNLSFDEIGDWISSAEILISCLSQSNHSVDKLEFSKIQLTAKNHIDYWGQLAPTALKDLWTESRKDKSYYRSFQLYSAYFGSLAKLAKIDYDQALLGDFEFNDLAIAAFCYSEVTNWQWGDYEISKPILELFKIGLQYGNDIPDLYFSRANFKEDQNLLAKIKNQPAPFSDEDIKKDLIKAIELDPKYEAASSRLNSYK